MKKIISTLLFVVGLVSFSFAQDVTNTALSNGSDDLAKSKVSGEYVFTLPSNITAEEVEKNSKYYTSTFTVSFDASSNEAKISMIRNEKKDRYVITRLLASCSVNYIKVGDTSYNITEFIESYL